MTTNKLPNKELLRPGEVADYFSVTKKTIYRWVDEGKIDATKVAGRTLRIPRDSLLKIQDDTLD